MKRNKIVKFGGIALAAAVLVTSTWYTGRETDDLSIPQIVEYIDTEDGSIVIPQEEVPLATKPTVKVKKTTKRKVKKSKLKQKAKKTAKTTKRTKKSKTVKKENSQKKVATDTTVLTTVVSATKKNSKVKTVTTTVVTTVKTTTTNKPKGSSSSAATTNTATTNTAAAAATASSDQLQTVSNVTVRSLASRADANVLNAFENLEFKIEVNPTSSYSGYFSVKAHNIILKSSSGNTIYHELGHFVGWLAGNVDTSSDFVAIYNQEKGALKSANYQYLTKSSAEYFAESYKDYVLSPQNLQSTRPKTYEFVKNAVSRITDARVSNIKSAYMKAYWS